MGWLGVRGERRGDPPARILARFPTTPVCGKWGEVIMEAAWGARRGGVLCLQAANRLVIIGPLR